MLFIIEKLSLPRQLSALLAGTIFRVLSVETKFSNETAIKEYLESSGYQVKEVIDGDAVIFVRSSEPK